MYQNNRNLFSFLAVLFTAGVIIAMGSASLRFIDRLGDGPQLVSSNVDDVPFTVSSRTVGTHSATVLRVSATVEAAFMASGSYDNTVQLWNTESQQSVSLVHSGRVNDLVFTPDEQLLVTGSGAGELSLWTVPTGSHAATIQTDAGRILSLAVDSSSQIIASGSNKGTLQLWSIIDSSQLQPLATLIEAGPRINAIAFHPTDDNILITGDQDGLIQIWDLTTRQIVKTLDDRADRIVSLAISSSGQYLASGSYDQTIRIWDLATGTLQQTLGDHDSVVSDVAFSPDDTVLASSSYDESIKTWDWANGQVLCTLSGHSGFVYTVAFTNGGNTLVSGGYDGTVRTWDLTKAPNTTCLPRRQLTR